MLFNQRSKREISPKPLQHHGKLIKEVTRGLSLRPAEIKQLRILAEEMRGPGGESLSSPLSLLLLPSVLAPPPGAGMTKANRKLLDHVRKETP